MLSYLISVSIIHQTLSLTWTTVSLTCVYDLFAWNVYNEGPWFIVSAEGLPSSIKSAQNLTVPKA